MNPKGSTHTLLAILGGVLFALGLVGSLRGGGVGSTVLIAGGAVLSQAGLTGFAVRSALQDLFPPVGAAVPPGASEHTAA